MPLFQLGDYVLHSGGQSKWKIDCDHLFPGDWQALAQMAVEHLPPFGEVVGVPRGGLPFADALRRFSTAGPLLIADDVLTTGASMQALRPAGVPSIGVVAFARGTSVPNWIIPLFRMPQTLQRKDSNG